MIPGLEMFSWALDFIDYLLSLREKMVLLMRYGGGMRGGWFGI